MPAKKKPSNRKPNPNRHAVRSAADGRFVSADSKQTRIERWSQLGVKGFAYFFRDTEPHAINEHNVYAPLRLTRDQAQFLKGVLIADGNGNWVHDTILNVGPRRHAKSLLFALVVLWLTCSRSNHVTQLSGNTEIHCRRVQLQLLKNIIAHSPKLRRIFNPIDKNFTTNEIRHPKNGSRIQMNPGSFQTAFGDKYGILWHSDLHALADDSAFNAMMAGLLDTANALLCIDSNVDPIGGRVHQLEQQAKADDTIFLKRTKYKSWQDFVEKAPGWISRKRAKQLKQAVLEVEWKRDLLGKRSDATNSLFPSSVINLCKSKYQIPISDISELTKGRAYKVGGGLDRSKSLFGGDNTVWTTILKVASPEHGEPEYYILNQQVIIPNTSRMIKKAILKDHERYSLDKVTLENYEVTDIASWLSDQKIPYELVSAHNTNQNISFTEFHRIAKEGRFHFPPSLRGLAKEMSTFTYTQKTGGVYSFGHSSQKFKDDRVYSVNWAIFSLRDAVMNLYTLGSFACKNKSARRHMCTLMGGELVLLCSESCQAFQEVEAMFKEFKQYQLDSELTIPEFFETKVKLEGARISQAA